MIEPSLFPFFLAFSLERCSPHIICLRICFHLLLVTHPVFLLLIGCSVMLGSLRPRGLQRARLPRPSLSPGALFKLMSSEPVMPSSHLMLRHPSPIPTAKPLQTLQPDAVSHLSPICTPVCLTTPFGSYASSPPSFFIPKGLITFWYSPLHFFPTQNSLETGRGRVL